MSWLSRLQGLVDEELHALHPRLVMVNVVGRLLPLGVASELRGQLLQSAGFSVGEGTEVAGQPRITGGTDLSSNLKVGRDCVIEVGCTRDASQDPARACSSGSSPGAPASPDLRA